jgi:uncharacterized protein (TIGR02246 family)
MSATNDEQAIRDLYATWRKATMAEDLPTVLGLIADDAVFYVPGQSPIRGKKEFETMFNATRGKFQIEALSEFEEIAVHGDWAHVTSRLAVNMKPRDGSSVQSRAGHTLTILRKDRGRWVVARDANLLAPDVG